MCSFIFCSPWKFISTETIVCLPRKWVFIIILFHSDAAFLVSYFSVFSNDRKLVYFATAKRSEQLNNNSNQNVFDWLSYLRKCHIVFSFEFFSVFFVHFGTLQNTKCITNGKIHILIPHNYSIRSVYYPLNFIITNNSSFFSIV